MKEMNKVLGYTSILLLSLLVLSTLIMKPNAQKKEYMGVVIKNYNGNSTVVLSEMEAPFKQTIKSNESIITGTILTSNGDNLVIKDENNTLYRIHNDKVNEPYCQTKQCKEQEYKIDRQVKASVVIKSNETRILKGGNQGGYEEGSIITLRDNLANQKAQYFTKEGESIYKANGPISEVNVEEDLSEQFVLVSHRQAWGISYCNGKYKLKDIDKHYHLDGLYKVDGNNLIPIPLSTMNQAPCSGGSGRFSSIGEVVNYLPFRPYSSNNKVNY